MQYSPGMYVSGQDIILETKLNHLVQSLMVLPSEHCEVLLQILETASSFEALQTALKAHSDLRSALEQYSIDIDAPLNSGPESDQKASFVPPNLQTSFQDAVKATVRYCWTNDRHALDVAVASWEYILNHPDFPNSVLEFRQVALNSGSTTFHRRYSARGQVEDLSQALTLCQQALTQTPPDSKKRAVFLCNLGIGLLTRYTLTRELIDLEQGIQLLREALDLIPLDSPSRPRYLMNLGTALLTRYSHSEQFADLEQGIQLCQEALALISLDPSIKLHCLMNLGTGLLTRYSHSEQFADLEQGIQLCQEALESVPLNSPMRLLCVMNLGKGWLTRYSHIGELADLEQAIQLFQEALSLALSGSPYRHLILITLGESFERRYRDRGELEDLEQALQIWHEALNSPLANNTERLSCLYLLGNGLLARYDYTGIQADLEQALQIWHEALTITPPNSPTRIDILQSLGRGLRRRYRCTGELVDLERSIQLSSEALTLTPPGSSRRANLLNSLGAALNDRYELTRESADLEKAFRCYNEALNLESLGLHTRTKILTNLGIGLITRYTLTGELADLEQAMQSWQQILDSTPADWSIRVASLSNLAIGLNVRYELTKELADLDQALHLYNQAINLTLPGSPDRAQYLTNFGSVLLSHYDHTGELADLKQAINYLQQAVDEALPNLSDWPLYLINLGEGLYTYYLYTREREDLEHANAVWNQAWLFLRTTFVTLPVSYKFGQQSRWSGLYPNLISTYLLLASIDRSKEIAFRRKALEIAESSKSRLLSQLVGRGVLSNPAGILPETVAREQALLAELTALDNNELVVHGRLVPDEESIDRATYLRHRQVCLQELEHLWITISRISSEAADYIALRRGDAPSWDDLIRLANELGQHTALLSFFTTVHRMRLFLVRKGWRGPRILEISLHENKWLDLLLRFSHEISGSGGSSRRGETWDQPLQVLLKQAGKHLGGVDRLILAPQGAGHLLPWSVVAQRAGWHTPEGLPLPVVTLPALGLLLRLRRRPRSLDGLTLVVGDPRSDLPFAEQEARTVAAQLGGVPLIGSQATKSAVIAQLEKASLIHLATHAFFVPGVPLDASIELADGELTTREVLQLRLQADLLVLSGCETGKAEALGGEELAGLAQAFLQAGVRSLLVSLWPVNDSATAAFMIAFYEARQAGMDKAQALRQAMTNIQQDPRWHHPYYWGAFVLIGDWE